MATLAKFARILTTNLRHHLQIQDNNVYRRMKKNVVILEHPSRGHPFSGKAMVSLQSLMRAINNKRYLFKVVFAFLQTDSGFLSRCRIEIDEDGVVWVGARYGHSFCAYRNPWFADLDLLYKKVTTLVNIGHVTTAPAASLIAKSGLLRMGRDTVHALPLEGNTPSDKGYSGKFRRSEYQKVVVLDVAKMLADHIPIYHSTEGETDIFLIPQDISPEYILKIVEKPVRE